jgi:hypothetical protein
MPHFGAANVGRLQPLLEQADLQPPLPEVEFSEPLAQVKRHGWRMVGIRGFACTQCHSFGRLRATGIQSIDMRTMTQRLREDWFRRYVTDPQSYRPRTRMPTAWPLGGKSPLADVLEGDNQQQIAAVWAYLSDGPRASIPEGLVTKSMELVPYNEAVIYRNFIEGAGSRAIGVGYPEGLHLAFDANGIRLALLWEGRFIDASRHWSGRGQGYQPPAGDNVLRLPEGPPLALLDSLEAPWPAGPPRENGYRFGGYRLGQELRPTFRYRFQNLQVEDFVDTRVASQAAPLRRTFRITSDAPAPDNLFLRAAAGRIERSGDWYEVDGRWKTRIRGAEAELRQTAAGQELLVPVQLKGGLAEIHQDYQW